MKTAAITTLSTLFWPDAQERKDLRMKISEAKQFIRVSLESLSKLEIRAGMDNVGYLAGAYQLLNEVAKNIDHLEADQPTE